MKIKLIICSALATVLLTGCVNINIGGHSGRGKKMENGEKCEKAEKGETARKEKAGESKTQEASQAELMSQAKINKETAQQTAQAKVPNGTVKASELEMESGKLQWSFDIATPDSQDITEVNVNAITGDVISVAKEPATSGAKAATGAKDED
ncbi:MAG TPA: PepSY domain-containing protein [Candidatus Paceibacterota bacterium]|nr:PepSY domain-containing protein [Candidatus Paceibacterota bacterium]